jgi:hypothetical protein
VAFRLGVVGQPRSDEADVVRRAPAGEAVASSSTRATAPPRVKIGMADSGEVMAAACPTITSIALSVSGGSFHAFQ